MKKYLIVLLSLFPGKGINAQQSPQFGIRAGVNFSSIGGDASKQLDQLLEWTDGMVSTSGRTGFYAGGFVQIPLAQNVLIEPGLSYSTKGYSIDGKLDLKGLDMLGVGADGDLIMQYLDMPVVLKATIGKGFQVFAGPQVSYLLTSDMRLRAGLLGVNLLNEKWNITNQFNRWDAAITGGLGYQFQNGLNVFAGYEHGLSRIDAGSSVNATNRNIRLGLSMRF